MVNLLMHRQVSGKLLSLPPVPFNFQILWLKVKGGKGEPRKKVEKRRRIRQVENINDSSHLRSSNEEGE